MKFKKKTWSLRRRLISSNPDISSVPSPLSHLELKTIINEVNSVPDCVLCLKMHMCVRPKGDGAVFVGLFPPAVAYCM